MSAPYYQDEQVTVLAGDCLEVMADMPAESVHAVVTDPPYGLEFMGKGWDAPWEERDVNADAGFHGGGVSATRNAPSFTGSTNPKCLTCKGTRRGRRDGTAKVAVCLCPDGGRFPNVRAVEMRAFQDWCEQWATECLRVLKPGGHLLAFGGSRTWHRLAAAIEDAGFEIRDSIAWLYGSGFPKSLDVSKAIDKDNGRKFEDRFALGRHIRERREALGITPAEVNGWFGYRDGCQHWERQDRSGARVPTLADWRVLRERLGLSDEYLPLVERAEAERVRTGTHTKGSPIGTFTSRINGTDAPGAKDRHDIPATPDAARWQGWGTALKPAFEPIVVARKPLTGTVAANVLEHGTGALNIDATRVGDEERHNPSARTNGTSAPVLTTGPETEGRLATGRWPTNVLLDDTQAAELDRETGVLTSGKMQPTHTTARRSVYGQNADGGYTTMETYGDSGGASRFFPTFRYEAKAPTEERPSVNGVAHPTVKPLELMRWLVRLVTPPGGTVLDPFAGSGTTLEAALIEGFQCIGIERETDYLPLIEARITKPLEPVLDLGGIA